MVEYCIDNRSCNAVIYNKTKTLNNYGQHNDERKEMVR